MYLSFFFFSNTFYLPISIIFSSNISLYIQVHLFSYYPVVPHSYKFDFSLALFHSSILYTKYVPHRRIIFQGETEGARLNCNSVASCIVFVDKRKTIRPVHFLRDFKFTPARALRRHNVGYSLLGLFKPFLSTFCRTSLFRFTVFRL